MSIVDLLIMLLIAGICGSIAQGIVGYSRGGCLTSIGLGFIGALFGPFLAKQAQMPDIFTISVGDHQFPIVWSIIGATLFVAIIGLISRRRR